MSSTRWAQHCMVFSNIQIFKHTTVVTSSRQAELLLSYVPLSSCMQAKVKAIHNWETTITSESKLAISSCPGRMFANSRHAWLVAELPDPLAFGTWLGPTMHKCQRSHRTGYYEFYINLFNLEVMLGYVLFSFKLEVNVFNLDIILHYFSSERRKNRGTSSKARESFT